MSLGATYFPGSGGRPVKSNVMQVVCERPGVPLPLGSDPNRSVTNLTERQDGAQGG